MGDEDDRANACARPKVVSCLLQAYNFEADFRLRTRPLFRQDDYKSDDIARRRQIVRTHYHISKRSEKSADERRVENWEAWLNRLRKSEEGGLVRILLLRGPFSLLWRCVFVGVNYETIRRAGGAKTYEFSIRDVCDRCRNNFFGNLLRLLGKCLAKWARLGIKWCALSPPRGVGSG